MLLIYAKHITSRLQYIAGVLWHNDVLFTNNSNEFIHYAGWKIAYAEEAIAKDAFHIQPYGLLEATGIQPQNTSCFTWQGLPVFFRTEKGSIPFDLFSAAFYLLTRYEEYLPHNKDEYDRYLFSESLAYKENFLHLPLIQLWMKALPHKAFHSSTNSFKFIPTYDIDIAYAYTHQPSWKNVLGFYRDLLKVDIDKVSERINVYSGRKKDPFDVFDWLDALHQKFHLQPVYFFLTILQRGLYDKNINSHNRSLQKLYKQLASKYNNGLHPSWQSGEHGFDALLNKEKQQLEKIIRQPVCKSRFHYLRFNLPEGYRKLIKNGITEDHSMGYATINGFRASYAKPFYWYDLLQEQKTDLLLHPFCWMDATASFEERLTAEEAYATLQTFYNLIRSLGGECTIILHNHFLTEQQDWIEWRKSYELFLSSNCNETAP